jgi:protein TonB
MDANKILNADVLDIIFEGKNKEYGAYNLRKTYTSRLTTALLITGGTLALIFLINFLAGAFHKDDTAAVTITDVSLMEVKKIPPPPPPPKAALPPPPVQAATVKFLPPVIKKDEDVPKDVKPPDQKDLDTKAISDADTKGTVDNNVVTPPPPTPPGTGVVETPVDPNQIFTKVEIEAITPSNWSSYLQNHLDVSVPQDNGAPPGKYTVLVQFVVELDGSVSGVNATTTFGYGMEEEAVRAVKNGPKWKPAQQNGRFVRAYRVQPITFDVQE